MSENSSVEIYEGDLINVWLADELIYIDIYPNGITMTVPEDNFSDLLDEVNEAKIAWDNVLTGKVLSPPVESKKKLNWKDEIENILNGTGNEELVARRFDNIIKILSEDRIEITDDWREVISQMFVQDIGNSPIIACCIRAFLTGIVWERYKDELDK